jgi:hypothetical protein
MLLFNGVLSAKSGKSFEQIQLKQKVYPCQNDTIHGLKFVQFFEQHAVIAFH